MSKKILVVLFYIILPNFCWAQDNIYAKLELSYAKMNKHSRYSENGRKNIDKSFFSGESPIGLELGYEISDSFKVGVNIQHKHSKFRLLSHQGFFFPVSTDDEYGRPEDVLCAPSTSAEIKIRTSVLLFNFYYFTNKFYNLSPYIIAGLGIAKHNNKESSTFKNYYHRSVDDSNAKILGNVKYTPAWSIGVGGQIPINDTIYFDTSLKYFNYGKIKVKSIIQQNNSVYNCGTIRIIQKGFIFSTGIVIKF